MNTKGLAAAFSFLVLWLGLALACNLPQKSRLPAFQATALEATRRAQLALPHPTLPIAQSSDGEGDPPHPTLAISADGEGDPAHPTLAISADGEGNPTPAVILTASPYPLNGLQTATAGPAPEAAQPTIAETPDPDAPPLAFIYWTQPGDTLPALLARFDVLPGQVALLNAPAGASLPAEAFLPPGLSLSIVNNSGDRRGGDHPGLTGLPAYPSALLPDSAVVNSPAAAHFQTAAFIQQAGGFLSAYDEELESGEWMNGAEIVQRVALETSTNPQLLLTFLEYRSHWVLGQPADPSQTDYPIGFYVPGYRGLYKELSLTAKQLNIGYYGWREGSVLSLQFPDETRLRLAPGLNAGSVALEFLASKFYRLEAWQNALFGPQSIPLLYAQLFGDPWPAAPLLPPDLAQPVLELPFAPGSPWSLTAGPHLAWNTGTPRGALDFAPITGEPACAVSNAWVTASAAGVVARSERGVLVLDLDGDGLEQTGWVLMYLHLAEKDRPAVGTAVQQDDRLGHPSCEGGQATGTHVHLARKYNGEWLAADGPLPFVLSGWAAHAGEGAYDGTLEKDSQIVSARPDGSHGSTITR